MHTFKFHIQAFIDSPHSPKIRRWWICSFYLNEYVKRLPAVLETMHLLTLLMCAAECRWCADRWCRRKDLVSSASESPSTGRLGSDSLSQDKEDGKIFCFVLFIFKEKWVFKFVVLFKVSTYHHAFYPGKSRYKKSNTI